MRAQQPRDSAAHVRVGVHGVHDRHVRKRAGYPQEREGKVAQAFSEALASVCRHKNNPLVREIDLGKPTIRRTALEALRGMEQRIDNRISSHRYGGRRNLLGQEILCGPLRGTEVEIRDPRNERSVSFLRVGLEPIVRPEACLYMAHRYLQVKGCQGYREC